MLVLVLVWWFILLPHAAEGQTPVVLSDFKGALDRANAATRNQDISSVLPGYGGQAPDLQAKADSDVATLQTDGQAAQAKNAMSGTLVHANAFVSVNAVGADASWVKGTLGIANAPAAMPEGRTGATSLACRNVGASSTSTRLYTCDSVTGATSDCDVPAGCMLKTRTCIDPAYDGSRTCQTYDYVYTCTTTIPQANGARTMCDASWVNGTAVITASDDPQNDLPEALSAINAVKSAGASFNGSGGVTIFSGENLKCGKSIGGLSNCCRDSGILNDWNLASCNAGEKKLAEEQAHKACHYVGTYCSNKSLLGCLQKKMTYCCYGSVLARIVEEAGHDQLAKSWGDAKAPQCGGFSVSEFQAIDLARVDFSDFYADKLGQLAQNDPNSTVAAITASISRLNAAQRPAK